MITTYLRKMLAVVICLMTGLTAQAQYAAGVEQPEGKFWKETPITFKLSDVAATLQTDTATLAANFISWQNAESVETNLLFLVNPDDQSLIDNYTCNGKGFFMLTNGALGSWGNNGTWYTYVQIDAPNDAFSFIVAQSDAVGEGVETLKKCD